MQTRFWRPAAAIALTFGVLSGCNGQTGDGAPGAGPPTPTEWSRPTGEALDIIPVDSIAGAEKLEVNGVSILVPQGWDVKQAADKVVISPVGDTTNVVGLIFEGESGDADSVERTATLGRSLLAMTGTVEDTTAKPASWPGWVYGSATTGVVDGTDAIEVTVLSASGRIVTVVARAPAGTIEDSLQFRVARSLKDLG